MSGGASGGTRWGVAAALVLLLLASLAPAGLGQRPRGSASLIFDSQTSEGHTVVVERVNSSEGGFVVLYEEAFMEGEVFESYRGASDFVEPGVHWNVTASFEEPLEVNRTIVAVFHKDTNGNRSLDVVETQGEEDPPYQGATGAVFDVGDVTVAQERASPAVGPAAIAAVLAGVAAALAARTPRRS